MSALTDSDLELARMTQSQEASAMSNYSQANADSHIRAINCSIATEIFWEFLGGSIQYREAGNRIRALGITVSDEEVRLARFEARPVSAHCNHTHAPMALVQRY